MLKFSDFISIDNDSNTNASYLMDLEGGSLFQLNGSALKLLQCIKEHGNYEAYVKEIASQTSTEESLVARDANKYVASLLDRGYLIES